LETEVVVDCAFNSEILEYEDWLDNVDMPENLVSGEKHVDTGVAVRFGEGDRS
jgi:hypothetical protein